MSTTLILSRKITKPSTGRYICDDPHHPSDIGCDEQIRIRNSAGIVQDLCPKHLPTDIWATAKLYGYYSFRDSIMETYIGTPYTYGLIMQEFTPIKI